MTMTSASGARADRVTYAAFDVSVPPTHEPGSPSRDKSPTGDPAHSFVVAGGGGFADVAAFGRAVLADAGTRGTAPEAFVFVHGFNTRYTEAIYQIAQIGNDLALPQAGVVYAWPSTGRIVDYMHDVDSIAFARDGLEQTLDGLADAGIRRIVLVGYSMGAALVVETLRQMKLVGSDRFFARLGGVVLLSPDMDVDLFRIEGERMGGLPQPFVIYGAPHDMALGAVARVLAADKPRLGALPDPDALANLNLLYVDVSNIPQHPQPGHLPVATAPSMIAAINAMSRPDLVTWAVGAAAGAVPGATVTHHGKVVVVTLPAPAS
jgi:esterase/lipase superfamily enzyme